MRVRLPAVFICLSLTAIVSVKSTAQWTRTSFPSTDVRYFAVDSLTILAASGNSVYASSDTGRTWIPIYSNALHYVVNTVAIKDSDFFAGTSADGLYRSTDRGVTWNSVGLGISNNNVMSLMADSTYVYAGAKNAVLVSSNNGNTWGYFMGGLTGQPVYSMAASDTSFYAATLSRGIFRSTTNTSQTLEDSGLTNIHTFAIAARDSSLFTGTDGGGIFISSDGGTSWLAADSGMSDTVVFWILPVASAVFAGTEGHAVFLSTDGAATWSAANSGITDKYGYALTTFGGYLFVGTEGGIWKRPISQLITAASDRRDILPDGFKLSQNYPNPFNPSTTIHFELPKQSQVRLDLFNMLGQSVMQVLDEKRQAGVYDVQIRAGNLSSGMYFYRLTAGDFVQTKKMVLMK